MSLGQRVVIYNKHRRFTVGPRQLMPRLSERRVLAFSEESKRAELLGWLGLTRECDCSRRSRKFNVRATIMEKREYLVFVISRLSYNQSMLITLDSTAVRKSKYIRLQNRF
jgi:hypothetical protein